MEPSEIATKTLTLLTNDAGEAWHFEPEEWVTAIPSFLEACPHPITTPNMCIEDYRLWVLNLLRLGWEVGDTKANAEASTIQVITAHRTVLAIARRRSLTSEPN